MIHILNELSAEEDWHMHVKASDSPKSCQTLVSNKPHTSYLSFLRISSTSPTPPHTTPPHYLIPSEYSRNCDPGKSSCTEEYEDCKVFNLTTPQTFIPKALGVPQTVSVLVLMLSLEVLIH